MKKIILLIFLLSSLFSSAQVRVSLKLKNNLEIKDSIKQIGEILISLKTDKKYKLNDVSEIKIYEKKKSKHYYILDVKSHKRSKQVQKGLGTKVFSNRNIELYFISFGFNIKNINYQRKFYDSNTEVFIKRKNSKYTYNIGCIDGVGCKNIKKRIYDFFSDCPSLIEKVKKNQINERNIKKIIDYYIESCKN
jgi:hypothetical protein